MSIKDPDAFERRVRPIYDALDSRNWKGALKLCQQALGKYPDNELVKMLKAIGLERSGKREEACQLAEEVAARGPTDDQVLRLGAMVLRSAGRPAAVTAMYEAAAARAPHDPGLQHEVYGCHVRECNYVKQQQVALRLSKAAAAAPAAARHHSAALGMLCGGGGPAPSAPADAGGIAAGERYGWWVVLSILLQARALLRARASGVASPAGQAPAVAMEPEKLLALAEGMVARQATKDGRLEGYEALMVYVDVLLAQGKAADALALVSGPLGAAALRLPAERLQLRAVLAALAGDLAAGGELLAEGLRLNCDDWGALLLLVDCMLPSTAAATGSQAAPLSPPATFLPQHPLTLISGGLAEQLPPRGVTLPPQGATDGELSEAFGRAEAVLKELVALSLEAAAGASGNGNGDGNGNGGGGDGRPSSVVMRGPDLALVDLAMRRHRAVAAGLLPAASSASSTGDDAGGECSLTEAAVADAVLSYFSKYGSLVSCAVDLRGYVSQLGAAAAARVDAGLQASLDAAADAAGPAATGAAAAMAADGGRTARALLRRRVCAAQIRDDLGLPTHGSPASCVSYAQSLLCLHADAAPLQPELDERERGAADEGPVLAAAALVSAAGMAHSDGAAVPYLLAAYGILSDAVSARPYSAGMRVALAALAGLLAAPAAAAAHLYKLDIKHIQLDSLGGHLLLPALLAWTPAPAAAPTGGAGGASAAAVLAAGAAAAKDGQADAAAAVLQRALRDTRALFEDHARDAGETLFTAYAHGMYTKVLEFTAFRERLSAAHTRCVARSEAAMGRIRAAAAEGGGPEALRAAAAQAAGELPADEAPSAGSLRYNWDLAVRPAWLPPPAAAPALGPLAWWRGRAGARGEGYGRRWWAATGAAEAPAGEAAAWRAAAGAAAAHRWLLPHCAAGALGAAGPEVLPLRTAVDRLRELHAPVPEPAAPQAGPGEGAADGGSGARAGGSGSGCSTEDLHRLDVELYGAALAVQDCLAAATPIAEADAAEACAALRAAAAGCCTALRAAADDVAAAAAGAAGGGRVLPCGGLGALAHLLWEPAAVLAGCLQTWQAALKALRKRRAKAAAAAGGADLEPGAAAVAAALAGAAQELVAAAAHCEGAAAAAVDALGGEGAAEQAAACVQATCPGLPLGPAGREALAALAAGQRAVAAQLGRAAGRLAAALA